MIRFCFKRKVSLYLPDLGLFTEVTCGLMVDTEAKKDAKTELIIEPSSRANPMKKYCLKKDFNLVLINRAV